MRGDETQSAGTERGPRHAAPRKSLLNKLHAPVGKAMALAAMPTAVIVGMGLAPRLALADDSKDIPFAPGPCVTRSDEPTADPSATPDTTQSPKPTASATATAKPTEEPAPDTSASAEPKPTATSDATAQPQTGAQAPAPKTTTAPAPTPTPTKSVNPLDPLGLGDALKDLFDGPDATTAPAPAPTSSATPTKAPTATAAPTKAPTAPSGTTADKSGTTATADTALDKTKAAIQDAADKAGATTEELDESAKGLEPTTDEDIPDGAKPRFPCPEPDPEALAAAELETGMPLLPDEPWRLETSTLELRGLKYHGIVEVKTGSGQIKKVLKFTADEVDIWNLHQLTVHSAGMTGHVRSDQGSKSTIRNGTVTMYTEELKGNLFGLIPVTFSPQSPPPLDVPWAVFTNCTVKQAGQFGGTLKVPGLRNTVEPNA